MDRGVRSSWELIPTFSPRKGGEKEQRGWRTRNTRCTVCGSAGHPIPDCLAAVRPSPCKGRVIRGFVRCQVIIDAFHKFITYDIVIYIYEEDYNCQAQSWAVPVVLDQKCSRAP